MTCIHTSRKKHPAYNFPVLSSLGKRLKISYEYLIYVLHHHSPSCGKVKCSQICTCLFTGDHHKTITHDESDPTVQPSPPPSPGPFIQDIKQWDSSQPPVSNMWWPLLNPVQMCSFGDLPSHPPSVGTDI